MFVVDVQENKYVTSVQWSRVSLVVMVMVIENTTSPSFSPVVPALVSSSLLSFSSFLSDWRSSGILNILGEEGVEEREESYT